MERGGFGRRGRRGVSDHSLPPGKVAWIAATVALRSAPGES
jgi:hypothetical protein